jgi:Zn-dependent protease
MAGLVAVVLAVGVLPSAFGSHDWTDRWLAAAIGTVLFLASLLVHELGHAVVARRHGVGVHGVTLWLLGGVARLDRQAPTPAAEARIAGAGPAASGVLGLALVGVALATRDWSWAPLGRTVVLWVGLVNLLLAGFNLLPGAPLDGGRLLAAALWRSRGDAEAARRDAGRAGLVLGAALVAAGTAELVAWGRPAGVLTGAVGVFLAYAARGEVAGACVRGRLRRLTMGELMTPHPPSVPDWLTAGQFLGWTGDRCQVVFPVVRWDRQPVGWVSPELASTPDPPARSWTRVQDLMLPDRLAPRAWSTEPVHDVLERLDDRLPHVVVVLDPRSGRVEGTVSAARLSGLLRPPGLWGGDGPTRPASGTTLRA